MSQSTHAPTESGLTGAGPVFTDGTRIAATAAIIGMFVIAVIAITTFNLGAGGWFALAAAVLSVLASGYLVGRHTPGRDTATSLWPGVATCAFAASAAVLSTIARTEAELNVVAALLLGLGWSFWVAGQGPDLLRYDRLMVTTMVVAFALAAVALAVTGWTDTLDSDADALILGLTTVLALLALLSRRPERQIASVAGFAVGAAILAGWLELDEWTTGTLALVFAGAIAWPASRRTGLVTIGRFEPWIGAAGALALFVAGVFSLGEPVRSFAFGGALVLFAGSLVASILQTRERESHVSELLDLNATIQDLARLDYLTGLPNREALELRLREEVERAVRYRQPLSIGFVDVDHFKRVNDTLGHQAGDELLRQIAAVIRTTIRTPDFVARYGGEEFVIIAPGTWTEDAIILGARIQSAIAEDVEQLAGLPITVSIGLAGIPEHGTTADEIVALADQALYTAKANGRNRIEISSESSDSSPA